VISPGEFGKKSKRVNGAKRTLSIRIISALINEAKKCRETRRFTHKQTFLVLKKSFILKEELFYCLLVV